MRNINKFIFYISHIKIFKALAKHILPNIMIIYLKKYIYKQYNIKNSQSLFKEKIDNTKCKGIIFVYHMGLGDALFTTPLIAECKKTWPNIPIHVAISSTMDEVNSPIVLDLLRLDPNIDNLSTYVGKTNDIWLNYDRSKVNIPDGFIMEPILWNPSYEYRTDNILKSYGFKTDITNIKPIVYHPSKVTKNVEEVLHKINSKNIIFFHLDTRSSHYTYPYKEKLAEIFIDNNFTIISFTHINTKNKNLINIDTKYFSIEDTISLFSYFKENNITIHGICVQSFLWPLSYAFSIDIIGLNIFNDPFISNYTSKNIHVISSWSYPYLDKKNITYLPSKIRRSIPSRGDILVSDYKPEDIYTVYTKTFLNKNTHSNTTHTPITSYDHLLNFKNNIKEINIEISNYCNRKCEYCPNSMYKNKDYTSIKDNTLKKILNELNQISYSKTITLHLYNEPMFDKDIFINSISMIKKYIPESCVYILQMEIS